MAYEDVSSLVLYTMQSVCFERLAFTFAELTLQFDDSRVTIQSFICTSAGKVHFCITRLRVRNLRDWSWSVGATPDFEPVNPADELLLLHFLPDF